MILRENTTSTVLLASTPKSLTPASEGQRGRGLPLPSLALPFLPSEMKPNYNNHEARHQNGRLKLKAFVRRFQHSSTPSPASTSLHQDCATASNRRCNLDFNSGSFRCCKQKEAGACLKLLLSSGFIIFCSLAHSLATVTILDDLFVVTTTATENISQESRYPRSLQR